MTDQPLRALPPLPPPSGGRWTTDRPTKEGYWWHRSKRWPLILILAHGDNFYWHDGDESEWAHGGEFHKAYGGEWQRVETPREGK